MPRQETTTERRGAETILLIDSEPTDRQILRQTLAQHGYLVIEAEGAWAVRPMIKSTIGPFDLLIVALSNGDVDMVQVVQQVNAHRPGIAVIYLSDARTARIAERLALSPLLVKPVGMRTLLQAVRQTLDAPRAHRAIAPWNAGLASEAHQRHEPDTTALPRLLRAAVRLATSFRMRALAAFRRLRPTRADTRKRRR